MNEFDAKIKNCGNCRHYSFSRTSCWCHMGHIPTPTVYFSRFERCEDYDKGIMQNVTC